MHLACGNHHAVLFFQVVNNHWSGHWLSVQRQKKSELGPIWFHQHLYELSHQKGLKEREGGAGQERARERAGGREREREGGAERETETDRQKQTDRHRQ